MNSLDSIMIASLSLFLDENLLGCGTIKQPTMDVSSNKANDKHPIFLKHIESLSDDGVRRAVIQYQSIELSYVILSGLLDRKWHELNEKKLAQKLEKLSDDVLALLSALDELATWLQYIKGSCLGSPKAAMAYHNDKLLYIHLRKLLLAHREPNNQQIVEELVAQHKKQLFPCIIKSKSSYVREITGSSNWYRLFIIRLKRIFEALVPVIKTMMNTELSKQYADAIKHMTKYSGTLLSILSWAFYLPRLGVNLFLLLKHTISNPWLDDAEKKLLWTQRFSQQMSQRWFELVNDSLWVAGGLLTCFLLTGGLVAAGSYLTFALYGLDCVVMAIKCGVELRALNKKKNHCLEKITEIEDKLKLLTNDAPNYQGLMETKQQLLQVIEQIDKQRKHQSDMAVLSLATTIGLFAAVALTLPMFAVPVVPLIGAVLIVVICVISFAAKYYLQKQKPTEKITKEQVDEATLFDAKQEDIASQAPSTRGRSATVHFFQPASSKNRPVPLAQSRFNGSTGDIHKYCDDEKQGSKLKRSHSCVF